MVLDGIEALRPTKCSPLVPLLCVSTFSTAVASDDVKVWNL